MLAIALAGCGRLAFDPLASVGGDGGGGDDGGGNVDSPIPPGTNVAFAVAAPIRAYMLGSIAGADIVCNQAAGAAHLPGNYVAWLSDSTTNAIDRLTGSRGWVRADGKPFVDTPADLIAGKIFYPLDVDEHGTALPPNTKVATGTLANGTRQGNDCNNYQALGSIEEGAAGWSADARFSTNWIERSVMSVVRYWPVSEIFVSSSQRSSDPGPRL